MIKKTRLFLQLVRPMQWSKNIFVLAPLFFSYNFINPALWALTVYAVLCFILASSSIYIINDIRDAKEDSNHPRKKSRPIASGKLQPFEAGILAFIIITVTIAILAHMPIACSVVMAIYFVMQICYTFHLKKQAIFDVLIIAAGFVLRVVMGGYAINVPISPWIILTTYLLALFLGFGKRYHELSIKGYDASRHSLKKYNKPLLDRLIGISCVSALLSYALYAVETARLLEKTQLVYTVVFVIFGLFRYLQVLYIDEGGGEPEKVLFHDKVFLANGIIWFIVTMLILLN